MTFGFIDCFNKQYEGANDEVKCPRETEGYEALQYPLTRRDGR
jgi:hypothetical protein